MKVRPSGMPALRSDLARHTLGPGGFRDFQILVEEGTYRPGLDADATVRHLTKWWARAIDHAELFFVDQDMAELALTASASLPAFQVDREDVPSPCGFILFARPIVFVSRPAPTCCGPGAHGEESLEPVVAAAWIAGEDTIVLNFYADLEATLANWPCGGKSIDANVVRSKSFSLTLTSPAWINFGDMAEAGDGFVWDALSVVKTTWLLMQQRFGDERKVRVGPPQRNTAGSTRKRPEVRVITLRRPAGEKSTGESDREWKHRWMVRGHWRMQPWGPKRERVRPVWIAPHIKGPEDKPLIGGEKVYHLKR